MNLYVKQSKEKTRNLYRILLIIFLSILVTYIVFKTGGTKTAWTQLNFIVIVLAAYYWKYKTGLLIAFALGMIVGPFMPLDVSQGVMQTPANWIIRMLIYIGVGFLAGHYFYKISEISEQIREKDLTNEFTGLYNTNKLFPELNNMINNDERFYLVFFKIANFQEISMYVSQSIVKEIIDNFIFFIENKYKGNNLYSSSENEFILVMKVYDKSDIRQELFKDIESFLSQAKVKEYTFNLIVKIGIVFHKDERIKARELFNSARIASNQNQKNETSIHVYDSNFEDEMKFIHEVSSSLLNAINNNEFYVVYQPIISINDNSISSVEVLARWDRGDRKPIDPAIFIKIAEETGLIQKITKEIIKKHFNQLINWREDNIKIKSSLNVTGDELMDNSFFRWIGEFVDKNHIDRSDLGIEITERAFPENGEGLNDVLSTLQTKGYTISIDDFGTGYNTLKSLREFKADIIKIDKYFIDRILEEHTRSLIGYIIKSVHEMGLLVVAEGVETKEQLNILKELGCDMIQGYYFSKPLLPDDFIHYYKSFNINKYLE